jgi:hypothetical protein
MVRTGDSKVEQRVLAAAIFSDYHHALNKGEGERAIPDNGHLSFTSGVIEGHASSDGA